MFLWPKNQGGLSGLLFFFTCCFSAFCQSSVGSGNGSWVAYLRDCYNLSTVTVGMVCSLNPDAALARLLTCQNKSTRLGFEMFLGLYRFNPSWQENRCPHVGSYCHPEDTSAKQLLGFWFHVKIKTIIEFQYPTWDELVNSLCQTLGLPAMSDANTSLAMFIVCEWVGWVPAFCIGQSFHWLKP